MPCRITNIEIAVSANPYKARSQELLYGLIDTVIRQEAVEPFVLSDEPHDRLSLSPQKSCPWRSRANTASARSVILAISPGPYSCFSMRNPNVLKNCSCCELSTAHPQEGSVVLGWLSVRAE